MIIRPKFYMLRYFTETRLRRLAAAVGIVYIAASGIAIVVSKASQESSDWVHFKLRMIAVLCLMAFALAAWFMNEIGWRGGVGMLLTTTAWTVDGYYGLLPNEPDWWMVVKISPIVGMAMLYLEVRHQRLQAMGSRT